MTPETPARLRGQNREGASDLPPPGWHLNAALEPPGRGARSRGATYGTRPGPSRLCRGGCRASRATALPRSRLAGPPPSSAGRSRDSESSWRRRGAPWAPPGEVGCARRGREPGPSRCVLFSPHPCRLQFGRAGSRGGGAAFLFPPSGSCLSLREPVKCRGEEIQTKKEREGEPRRGPTPPSPCGEGGRESPPGAEAGERSGGLQGRSGESAGLGGAAGGTAGERSPRGRAA